MEIPRSHPTRRTAGVDSLSAAMAAVAASPNAAPRRGPDGGRLLGFDVALTEAVQVVGLDVAGKRIATTEDHPFWNVTDGEWQRADQLDRGDKVRTAGGRALRVDGLRPGTARQATAYNLTVKGIHTYHVGAGDRSVLVHNTCGPSGSGSAQTPASISMDEAVARGAAHVDGAGEVVPSGSGGYQFISHSADDVGNRISKIARFDVNPASPHVQKYGPHLNLETQINGRTIRSGPLADPHTPIDPTTVRPGDIP